MPAGTQSRRILRIASPRCVVAVHRQAVPTWNLQARPVRGHALGGEQFDGPFALAVWLDVGAKCKYCLEGETSIPDISVAGPIKNFHKISTAFPRVHLVCIKDDVRVFGSEIEEGISAQVDRAGNSRWRHYLPSMPFKNSPSDNSKAAASAAKWRNPTSRTPRSRSEMWTS